MVRGGDFREILLFLCIKLIFLSILFFYIFKWIAPEYAFSALLLSGISTGVVAPFFADTLEADVSKVILVVVTSSILVPFTLPVLVECLIGRQMDISLRSMVQLLSLVVFIPALGVEVLRRIQPSAIDLLLRVQQPFSLVLFALTNIRLRDIPHFCKTKHPLC